MREISEIKALVDQCKTCMAHICDCDERYSERKTALLEALTASIPLDRLEAICAAEREGRVAICREPITGLGTFYDTPDHCPVCFDHMAADWMFCPYCGWGRAEAEAAIKDDKPGE